MLEQDFINIIKKNIGNEFIGDDCAYLKDLGIVVSQDNFIEDIHFKKEWYTPFQLGYKAMAINISDILASGAEPIYASVGLSLPNNIPRYFIDEFYKGAKSVTHGAKIIGGDITGADKIFVSITVIGKVGNRKISSRKHAKVGYRIVTRGEFGASSRGLNCLLNNKNNEAAIRAHLMPVLDEDFSRCISEQINCEYAMMDTSDSLADALYKFAEASNVSIKVKNITGIFGAEDFKLVAALPLDFISKMPIDVDIIGDVIPQEKFVIKIGDNEYYNYDDLKLFNHFGGDNE